MNVRTTVDEEQKYKAWAAILFLRQVTPSSTLSDLVRLAMKELQAQHGLPDTPERYNAEE